jgi:hypothetical protein
MDGSGIKVERRGGRRLELLVWSESTTTKTKEENRKRRKKK